MEIYNTASNRTSTKDRTQIAIQKNKKTISDCRLPLNNDIVYAIRQSLHNNAVAFLYFTLGKDFGFSAKQIENLVKAYLIPKGNGEWQASIKAKSNENYLRLALLEMGFKSPYHALLIRQRLKGYSFRSNALKMHALTHLYEYAHLEKLERLADNSTKDNEYKKNIKTMLAIVMNLMENNNFGQFDVREVSPNEIDFSRVDMNNFRPVILLNAPDSASWLVSQQVRQWLGRYERYYIIESLSRLINERQFRQLERNQFKVNNEFWTWFTLVAGIHPFYVLNKKININQQDLKDLECTSNSQRSKEKIGILGYSKKEMSLYFNSRQYSYYSLGFDDEEAWLPSSTQKGQLLSMFLDTHPIYQLSKRPDWLKRAYTGV